MRIYAHYDSEGNIHSLTISSAPEGVEVVRPAFPGLSVGEIEGLTLKDEGDWEEIHNIAESYRIETSRTPLKLLKKN